MWSVNIRKVNTAINSQARLSKSECEKVGRYDIPPWEGPNITPVFVQKYYDLYCKKNENSPWWNRAYGEKAKCYKAILICGDSIGCNYRECISKISSTTKCLNKEVDFKNCIDANKAPVLADPRTPAPWGRCSGPCYNDTQVGDCLTGYAKRCICNGMSAQYKDDPQCAPTPIIAQQCKGPCSSGTALGDCVKGYALRCQCSGTLAKHISAPECAPAPINKPCIYGGNPISGSSSPYSYDKNNNFCIVETSTGKYIGSRCYTDDDGSSFIKSDKDREGLCINLAPTFAAGTKLFTIPTTACGAKHEQLMKDKTKCEFGKDQYVEYGKCIGEYICRCDDKGKYTYPTLVNSPNECQ